MDIDNLKIGELKQLMALIGGESKKYPIEVGKVDSVCGQFDHAERGLVDS